MAAFAGDTPAPHTSPVPRARQPFGMDNRRTCGVMGWPSEDGQVAVQFEPGDLAAVLDPFRALVAQEEVEHLLAERVRGKLAALHRADGLVQVLRQRLDAERAPLR